MLSSVLMSSIIGCVSPVSVEEDNSDTISPASDYPVLPELDETIRDVKLKLPKSLTEWEKMNPSYKKDPKLMDEWMNIMAGISESDTGTVLKDKLALKRKIATYIELKEAMAAEKK